MRKTQAILTPDVEGEKFKGPAACPHGGEGYDVDPVELTTNGLPYVCLRAGPPCPVDAIGARGVPSTLSTSFGATRSRLA
jgi:hypothetical protein